jgi:hypothetical protein
VPILTTKGWNVRSLTSNQVSWPITACKISLSAKQQKTSCFSTSCTYWAVPPGDHWQSGPNNPVVLPPLMNCPSYKAHNPICLGCCTPNLRVSLAVCASNKSFFSTHVVVSVRQFLTTWLS